MFDLTSLIKRNIKIFIRDKAAVFFSFLSVIILLSLYFLFIGRQYTSGGSFDSTPDDIKTFLSMGVIMGGVLVINTVSLSLGVMGSIVTDIDTRKLDGYLVTPVKRYKIVLSYYLSSIIVTATLTIFMWLLTVLYVGLNGHWYSLETILIASALVLFYTFISSALMLFLVTMIKSVNAYGALAGILGTVIGFMSGIYMPLEVLGAGMTKVASLVPFTHMTILLKQVLLKEPYALLHPDFQAGLEVPYGTINIGVFGIDIAMPLLMLGSFGIALILLALAYRNMNKKMGK